MVWKRAHAPAMQHVPEIKEEVIRKKGSSEKPAEYGAPGGSSASAGAKPQVSVDTFPALALNLWVARWNALIANIRFRANGPDNLVLNEPPIAIVRLPS